MQLPTLTHPPHPPLTSTTACELCKKNFDQKRKKLKKVAFPLWSLALNFHVEISAKRPSQSVVGFLHC